MFTVKPTKVRFVVTLALMLGIIAGSFGQEDRTNNVLQYYSTDLGR